MKTSNLFWQCVSLVLFLCVVVLLFSDEWIVSWPAKVTAVKGDVNGSFFWSNLNFYGIVGVVLALYWRCSRCFIRSVRMCLRVRPRAF